MNYKVTLTKKSGSEEIMVTLNVNHTVDSAAPDDGTGEVRFVTVLNGVLYGHHFVWMPFVALWYILICRLPRCFQSPHLRLI